jgi:hypothetical protein
MATYFQRVALLQLRAQGQLPDGAVMKIALERVKKDEWIFTYPKAVREVEQGRITTLAGLRAFMQQEALAEPGKTRASSSSSSQPSSSSASSSSSNSNSRGGKHRVNVAGHQSESAPTTASTEKVVNALHTRGGQQGERRCYRCKEVGHFAASCSKPDTRECYVCGKVGTGHSAKDCPDRKRAVPKNE